jgi:dTDP-4-dehydrorhamnose 3,5-epimerase
MTFTPTPLNGAFIIGLEPFTDERGWFARFYDKKEFGERIGHTKEWVQLNHSVSYARGTIRGMHFQHPPYREIKMVRCIAGAVLDIIVDLRHASPSFLQWTPVELSAKNSQMLYIPEGFAHGFQTLEENSALLYHHSEYYTPGAEGGFRYDDPSFAIQWPLPVNSLSARDANHPNVDKNFKGI